MKKLSNDQSVNNQRKSWLPSPMGAEAPRQVPSFLFEKKTEQSPGSPKQIIKKGRGSRDQFQSWFPVDVIEENGWEQPLPGTTSPGNGSFLNSIEFPETQNRAEAEMEKLVAQAERKAERVLRQDQEQRIQSARTEAKQLLSAAEAVLRKMEQARQDLLDTQEESILRLVLEISRNLFGKGFDLDQKALQNILQDALLEARELGELTLYINPEDQQKLDPHWPENAPGLHRPLRVAVDPEISPGGCLVEGEHGLVDARVSTKLKNIREALLAVQTAHHADQTEPGNQP